MYILTIQRLPNNFEQYDNEICHRDSVKNWKSSVNML